MIIRVFFIGSLLVVISCSALILIYYVPIPFLPTKKVIQLFKSSGFDIRHIFSLITIAMMLVAIFTSMISSREQLDKMQEQINQAATNTKNEVDAIKTAVKTHLQALKDEASRERKQLLKGLISEVQTNIDIGKFFYKHLELTDENIAFYNNLSVDILNINLSRNTIRDKALLVKVREYKSIIEVNNNFIKATRDRTLEGISGEKIVDKWEELKKGKDIVFSPADIKKLEIIVSKYGESPSPYKKALFFIVSNILGNKEKFERLKLALEEYSNSF